MSISLFLYIHLFLMLLNILLACLINKHFQDVLKIDEKRFKNLCWLSVIPLLNLSGSIVLFVFLCDGFFKRLYEGSSK